MRMRMRIENLIHIIHIWIFAKNGNFLGQKWVSLALFSILSAQNIIIVHTSWFYPSSGMKIKSPKSQNFGQEKMIFFYYWCGLCALMRIWCASMRISKNRRMANPNTNTYIPLTYIPPIFGSIYPIPMYIYQIMYTPQPLAQRAHRQPPTEKCPPIVGSIYPIQIHILENVHSPTLCPKGTQTPPNWTTFHNCWQ